MKMHFLSFANDVIYTTETIYFLTILVFPLTQSLKNCSFYERNFSFKYDIFFSNEIILLIGGSGSDKLNLNI